jgi:hypothetical protein
MLTALKGLNMCFYSLNCSIRQFMTRSKMPPMPGWKTDEINWKLPILVLLNCKFNGVQSGIANASYP